MNCMEIIKAYLKEHGYDGLAGDECGCGDVVYKAMPLLIEALEYVHSLPHGHHAGCISWDYLDTIEIILNGGRS